MIGIETNGASLSSGSRRIARLFIAPFDYQHRHKKKHKRDANKSTRTIETKEPIRLVVKEEAKWPRKMYEELKKARCKVLIEHEEKRRVI